MTFLLKTLIGWRKFIISAGLITAAVMVVISLSLPKWYTASTSIFPPETEGGMTMYAELIQSLQLPVLGPTSLSARPVTIYISILMSNKIGEQIVEEFNLREVYEINLTSKVIHELHEHSSFMVQENGLLIVSFEDKDPERAAAIANRYIELLDEFNKESNISRASRTRKFIEKQIDYRRGVLVEAEEELKKFQEENKALDVSVQVNSALALMSELTGQAIALEVELEILRQYTSMSSDEYVSKKQRFDEVNEQLRKFKMESAREEEDVIRSFFPTLDVVPQVALDLLRLTRRVKIEETVYELLVKEYEMARIEEARDTPTIQILDTASVPELRSRPKRKILVLFGGLVGIAWSALLSIFVTLWREEEKQRDTVKDVLKPVLDDFSRIFRRKRD